LSTVAKGQRREKACEDELVSEGYKTWRTVRHKWLRLDVFGLFDVIGLHPNGDHIRFIQVKSNRMDQVTRDKIKNLKMPPGCIKETWIMKDRWGWIKERYE